MVGGAALGAALGQMAHYGRDWNNDGACWIFVALFDTYIGFFEISWNPLAVGSYTCDPGMVLQSDILAGIGVWIDMVGGQYCAGSCRCRSE